MVTRDTATVTSTTEKQATKQQNSTILVMKVRRVSLNTQPPTTRMRAAEAPWTDTAAMEEEAAFAMQRFLAVMVPLARVRMEPKLLQAATNIVILTVVLQLVAVMQAVEDLWVETVVMEANEGPVIRGWYEQAASEVSIGALPMEKAPHKKDVKKECSSESLQVPTFFQAEATAVAVWSAATAVAVCSAAAVAVPLGEAMLVLKKLWNRLRSRDWLQVTTFAPSEVTASETTSPNIVGALGLMARATNKVKKKKLGIMLPRHQREETASEKRRSHPFAAPSVAQTWRVALRSEDLALTGWTDQRTAPSWTGSKIIK